MNIITQNQLFPISEVLFTFALASEAASVFDNHNTLITGVGKVNAAYELTKRLSHTKPSLIVNLGSAGSNIFQRGEVVCCTNFVQRDMDVRGLGFALYETPFQDGRIVLEYGEALPDLPLGICGTGDNFEMGHTEKIYNVVDMEAYALAMIAQKENIPFLCLKYITDGADYNAADDWTIQVHNAAMAYGKILNIITL